MSTRVKDPDPAAKGAGTPKAMPGPVNEVRLRGRVSKEPAVRTMPSGDEMWTFAVIVDRGGSPRRSRHVSKQTVDVIDCAVWAARPRRVAARLRPGDMVEATGALHRRFFRTGGSTGSRVEVELETLRTLRRGPSA